MSIWTHVAGLIRIDTIQIPGAYVDEDNLVTRLGKISTFEEPVETKVPIGSEGSLRYEIIDTDITGNSMTKWAIAIWGDLRDFDENDTDSIIKWIKKVTEGLMVRNGILTIETEGVKTIRKILVMTEFEVKGKKTVNNWNVIE